MSALAHRGRDERGFSMLLVIMVLFTTSMFVAAGFAMANGDVHLSGAAKDRKAAYAAAEAGVNFYLTHLGQDNDYWTKCDNVPPPNGTELNPVNQPWNGVGADPRRWRTIAGSSERYTLELLPTAGHATCDPTDQTSMLDMSTGTFRIRSTGASSKTSGDAGHRRSIVATFRRHGFLDFLYFTYYEDIDPQALSTPSARSAATTNCAGKFRSARSGCTEIQFVTGDQVKGPLHTNDSLLICNQPIFGRTTADKIEVTQTPGRVAAGACTDQATMKGVYTNPASLLDPPSSDATLKATAQANGYLFTGKTFIRLNTTSMTVTTTNGLGGPRVTMTKPFPPNGVIFVQNDNGTCTPQYPTSANYGEELACGNVYVSGTYSSSLTIAADNDVIVAPTDGVSLQWGNASYSPDIVKASGSNALLGLIANNFVRVAHKVNIPGASCTANATSAYDGRGTEIDAAILSLWHSFIVDNYDCGSALGNLTVNGAIAQRYRGPVGTTGGTGYLKDYLYDDRLRFRSPPYFLNPVDSAWFVVRSNEQVPAR